MMNATPIRSEEGDLESVVVTLQDMTALEELERLRAEFLGMVSHDLPSRRPSVSFGGFGLNQSQDGMGIRMRSSGGSDPSSNGQPLPELDNIPR